MLKIDIFFVIIIDIQMIVNRRLDEWVKLEQLDLDSVETVVDEKVEDKVNICFQRGTLHFSFLIL